jgi:hypothetical protein
MNRPAIGYNPLDAMKYVLGALTLILLVSCALPYAPAGFSASTGAVTDILKNPTLRIPIFLAGLALLLAGVWLAEYVIALPGFVIGAVLGASIGTAAHGGNFGILSVLLALVAGIFGAWLAMALFFLGVFFSGFVTGFILGGSIGTAISLSRETSTIIGIVFGLFAGILAAAYWQFLQMIISAGVGAVLISTTLGIDNKPILMVIIWAFGIAWQWVMLKVIGPLKKDVGPVTPDGTLPPAGQD